MEKKVRRPLPGFPVKSNIKAGAQIVIEVPDLLVDSVNALGDVLDSTTDLLISAVQNFQKSDAVP